MNDPSNGTHVAKATLFRRRLATRQLLIGVGAHDALGAHLIAEAGFDFVWASGLGISTMCGVPDASIASMDRFLDCARLMDSTTHLPVIADCDTGFGSLNNAIYMAGQYARANIAGVCIEDKQFPKRNSFSECEHPLESISDFSRKLRSIKHNSVGSGMTLVARTEAFIAGRGRDEALARAYAYEEAGADAILVHSKSTDFREIEGFMSLWHGSVPIIIAPTTYTSVPMDSFRQMGIAGVICANQLLRASIKQMRTMLTALRSASSLADVDSLISPLNDAVRMFTAGPWVDLERRHAHDHERTIAD